MPSLGGSGEYGGDDVRGETGTAPGESLGDMIARYKLYAGIVIAILIFGALRKR